MTILTEGLHAGEFMFSEANKTRSRDQITVLSGQNLPVGAVIGRSSRTSAAAPNPAVVGTGNGTMTNVRPGPDVQTGSYVVKLKTVVAHGGVFSVTAPDGSALPDFTLTPGAGATSNYNSSHIKFSITDGSTDFILDDTFTIAVTSGGTPVIVGTGNGVLSAITFGPQAENGTYRLQVKTAAAHGGTFSVTAPSGGALPDFVLAAGSAGQAGSYTSEHINFTFTDGSTDVIVGDYFHIVAAGGSKKVVAFNPAAVDGSEDVAGIMFDAVDATLGDKDGVIIARDAEVNWNELSWAAGVTFAQKVAADAGLFKLGIICLDENGSRRT